MIATVVTCYHCDRAITFSDADGWIDPEAPATPADGDDHIWRETCDAHDTFDARHEPRQAGLGVGHIWTAVQCRAYRTSNPHDCTCTA